MPARDLPARPDLDQYKKQAKELLTAWKAGETAALQRVAASAPRASRPRLTDAQFVLAREHGFDSWPKFARHIEQLLLDRAVAAVTDPVTAFIEACVPRQGYASGSLDHAEAIRKRYPEVTRDFYAAAAWGDVATVRDALVSTPALAVAPGGPHRWDALTYLCFSRYLRLDRSRSSRFVATARTLLSAGANARTGWYETIDHPNPRPVFESAIYGAAGVAQQADLTRLLLEHGADPNDEETPYHVAETTDNTVLRVLLDSGRLNEGSKNTLLLRKADWHDGEGMKLMVEAGASPNALTGWGQTALHQSVRRDNDLRLIEGLLDHAADPLLRNREGLSAAVIAARRGRGDVLTLLAQRGIDAGLAGVDRLIAACAIGDEEVIRRMRTEEPDLFVTMVGLGGTLLAEFAGNGNAIGVRRLMECGVEPAALHEQGDGYFGVAPRSTALHVAAWRAWPEAVATLIRAGTPMNAIDGQGRTALVLAVKACVDSYWSWRRTPECVRLLLEAGASPEGIELPTGYDEIDRLLTRALDS